VIYSLHERSENILRSAETGANSRWGGCSGCKSSNLDRLVKRGLLRPAWGAGFVGGDLQGVL